MSDSSKDIGKNNGKATIDTPTTECESLLTDQFEVSSNSFLNSTGTFGPSTNGEEREIASQSSDSESWVEQTITLPSPFASQEVFGSMFRSRTSFASNVDSLGSEGNNYTPTFAQDRTMREGSRVSQVDPPVNRFHHFSLFSNHQLSPLCRASDEGPTRVVSLRKGEYDRSNSVIRGNSIISVNTNLTRAADDATKNLSRRNSTLSVNTNLRAETDGSKTVNRANSIMSGKISMARLVDDCSNNLSRRNSALSVNMRVEDDRSISVSRRDSSRSANTYMTSPEYDRLNSVSRGISTISANTNVTAYKESNQNSTVSPVIYNPTPTNTGRRRRTSLGLVEPSVFSSVVLQSPNVKNAVNSIVSRSGSQASGGASVLKRISSEWPLLRRNSSGSSNNSIRSGVSRSPIGGLVCDSRANNVIHTSNGHHYPLASDPKRMDMIRSVSFTVQGMKSEKTPEVNTPITAKTIHTQNSSPRSSIGPSRTRSSLFVPVHSQNSTWDESSRPSSARSTQSSVFYTERNSVVSARDTQNSLISTERAHVRHFSSDNPSVGNRSQRFRSLSTGSRTKSAVLRDEGFYVNSITDNSTPSATNNVVTSNYPRRYQSLNTVSPTTFPTGPIPNPPARRKSVYSPFVDTSVSTPRGGVMERVRYIEGLKHNTGSNTPSNCRPTGHRRLLSKVSTTKQ